MVTSLCLVLTKNYQGYSEGSGVTDLLPLPLPSSTLITKDLLETLHRVTWGLDTALQVRMLFEEESPIAVVDFTSPEQGKDVGI